MNELGAHYIDLDEYLLNVSLGIYDFIDLVKMAIKKLENTPYWSDSNGQSTLQKIIENLEAYSVLINNNLKS